MVGENVDLQSIAYNAESEANEDYPNRGQMRINHTPRPSFHDITPVLIMDTAGSGESPRSDLADDEYPSNHSGTMSCHSIHSSSRSFESPRNENEEAAINTFNRDFDQNMDEEECKSRGKSSDNFSYPSPPVR